MTSSSLCCHKKVRPWFSSHRYVLLLCKRISEFMLIKLNNVWGLPASVSALKTLDFDIYCVRSGFPPSILTSSMTPCNIWTAVSKVLFSRSLIALSILRRSHFKLESFASASTIKSIIFFSSKSKNLRLIEKLRDQFHLAYPQWHFPFLCLELSTLSNANLQMRWPSWRGLTNSWIWCCHQSRKLTVVASSSHPSDPPKSGSRATHVTRRTRSKVASTGGDYCGDHCRQDVVAFRAQPSLPTSRE